MQRKRYHHRRGISNDNGISSKSCQCVSQRKVVQKWFLSWPKWNWSIWLDSTTSETTYEGFDQIRLETGILCPMYRQGDSNGRHATTTLFIRCTVRPKYCFQSTCFILIKFWRFNSRRWSKTLLSITYESWYITTGYLAEQYLCSMDCRRCGSQYGKYRVTERYKEAEKEMPGFRSHQTQRSGYCWIWWFIRFE